MLFYMLSSHLISNYIKRAWSLISKVKINPQNVLIIIGVLIVFILRWNLTKQSIIE